LILEIAIKPNIMTARMMDSAIILVVRFFYILNTIPPSPNIPPLSRLRIPILANSPISNPSHQACQENDCDPQYTLVATKGSIGARVIKRVYKKYKQWKHNKEFLCA